jgi:spore germination protein KC
MFMYRKAIWLLLILLLILPGCWSRKELNELAVVAALGVDTHKSGFLVTAQVINSSEIGKQRSSVGATPVVTYQAVGITIPDALQRVLSQAPRQLYLSHLRVLVLGEALARSGISDVLDYVSRSPDFRTDFFMLVAQHSKARDVLNVLTSFEPIPANSLFSSILVSHKNWAATGMITLQQYITELERAGSNPILSGVRVIGSQAVGYSSSNLKKINPDAQLQHAGIAVFKKDKLVGWLEESKSKTVNYILNEVSTTIGHVPCPGSEKEVVGIEIFSSDTKMDVKLDQQGKPQFTAHIHVETNLNAVQCAIDLSKSKNIDYIQNQLKEKLEGVIGNNIRDVQAKYGADIFGFGEVLHREYPKVWAKYRNHWESHFKTMSIQIKASVAVRHIGSIIQPVRREIDQR